MIPTFHTQKCARSASATSSLWLAVSLTFVGCGGSQPAAADVVTLDAPNDLGGKGDIAETDAGVDATIDLVNDLSAADVAVDAPALDLGSEVGAAEAGADAPTSDLGSDLSAADVAVDAPALDLGSEVGAAEAGADAPTSDLGSDLSNDLGAVDASPLLPVGGRCAGDTACASGMCASVEVGCAYDPPDAAGWVRSTMGACPSPATVTVYRGFSTAYTLERASRSDGYCWVRLLTSSGESVDPRTVTAYPTACSSGCVQPLTSMGGTVTGAVGRCVTVSYCTALCRSVDDCPTGSNWSCAARVGVPNRCICAPRLGVEEQCNGIDDNCDGITDDASIRCGGACVDRSTDRANCGGCGVACRASEVCVAGSCQCPGLMGAFCSRVSACRDLGRDVANCGGCGVTCTGVYPNATPSCRAGACGFTCNVGFGDCDGNAVNGCESGSLLTDTNNCGACGTRCARGGACVGGRCSCPAGSVVCGGACANLTNDRANCGACGVACPAGQDCNLGVCVASGVGVCPTTCTSNTECQQCWAPGEVRTGGSYGCYSGLCLYSATGDGGVDVLRLTDGALVCSRCSSDLDCRMCGQRCVPYDGTTLASCQ
jgi:hypothetical protein